MTTTLMSSEHILVIKTCLKAKFLPIQFFIISLRNPDIYYLYSFSQHINKNVKVSTLVSTVLVGNFAIELNYILRPLNIYGHIMGRSR